MCMAEHYIEWSTRRNIMVLRVGTFRGSFRGWGDIKCYVVVYRTYVCTYKG